MNILPPRKKDWKKGNWQVGLFIRTPDGSQVASVWDEAPEPVKIAALALLNERFPEAKALVRTLAGEPLAPGAAPAKVVLSDKDAKKIRKRFEKGRKR
jgi:hypothetical protein